MKDTNSVHSVLTIIDSENNPKQSNVNIPGEFNTDEMELRLTEICEKLTVPMHSFDKEMTAQLIHSYISCHKRFLYSAVSTYVFRIPVEALGTIHENLQDLLLYVVSDEYRANYLEEGKKQNDANSKIDRLSRQLHEKRAEIANLKAQIDVLEDSIEDYLNMLNPNETENSWDYFENFSNLQKAYDKLRMEKDSVEKKIFNEEMKVFEIRSKLHREIDEKKRIEETHQEYLLNNLNMVQRSILKLLDHFNLAQRQCVSLKQNDDDYKEQFSKNMIGEREKIENQLKDFNKDMTSHLISLVSIFTALSFLLFGGISSLDNIFIGANSLPLNKLITVGSIWCFCILNLVFIFMFFAAKLTGGTIATTDDKDASIFQKHPLVIWTNYVLICTTVLGCWSHYIKTEEIAIELYRQVKRHGTFFFLSGSLFLLFVGGLIFYRLTKEVAPESIHDECNDSKAEG